MIDHYKSILIECFKAGVDACLPATCLPPFLADLEVKERLCVLGAGKAAVQMAAVLNAAYPGACYGTVVTRHGHGAHLDTGAISVLQAGHPVPDFNSLKAAEIILKQAAEIPEKVPAVVLLSGGGSALMCLPVPGVSFADKMAVHKFLLQSGASIDEINCVRKQLSAIKGGQLGAALGDSLRATYIISDVAGDDPSTIASGPTTPDNTGPVDAIAVLEKYHWPEVPTVVDYLRRKKVERQQLAGDVHIIANATQMLEAAASKAAKLGWVSRIINAEAEGEATKVARNHASIALEAKKKGQRIILLSGGELTVTHDGKGKGGPNQEYLLALAVALEGETGIYALACDSDGIDGSEDNAGAYISPETLIAGGKLGLSAAQHLEAHDSYSFFKAIDDLVVTGPTGTNVNDFRAILVDP